MPSFYVAGTNAAGFDFETRSLAEAAGIGTGPSRRLAGPYSTTAIMVFSLIAGEGRG
jgi:hypothetical protein